MCEVCSPLCSCIVQLIMFSTAADYRDPSIVKTLNSPEDSQLSLTKCYEPEATQFSSIAAYNIMMIVLSLLIQS